MRVAHVLRKYNPAEWGGTETALQRLFDGLRPEGVTPVIFSPKTDGNGAPDDPFERAGYTMKRFHACVPIWGLPEHQRRQQIAVGGNLMSFDLISALWREREVQAIHSHTLGRIGIGLDRQRDEVDIEELGQVVSDDMDHLLECRRLDDADHGRLDPVLHDLVLP